VQIDFISRIELIVEYDRRNDSLRMPVRNTNAQMPAKHFSGAFRVLKDYKGEGVIR